MKRPSLRKAILLITFLAFPVVLYYLSPYLIIAAGAEGILSGSFLMFGIFFLVSLLLGRAYCGWVCPAAGLQETCFEINPRRVRGGDWIKWVIWVPWILGIVMAFWHAGGIHRLQPGYMTDHGISVSGIPGYITYYAVIGLIVILAWSIGRRSFCHHGCWMAPFMILGRGVSRRLNFPRLQLAADASRCQHCHTCTQNCPMSLDVEHMVAENRMENNECILCGTCGDHCDHAAIRYRFGKHT